MRNYYVIVNDQQQGPFTVEQLAELGITPETEVWAQGMADWQQAGDVAELTPLLQQLEFRQHINSTPPPHTPRQPAAAPAPPASEWGPQPGERQPRRRSGVKWLIALLCLLLVVTVLAVTCPSSEKHKDAIARASQSWLTEKVQLLTSPLGEFAPLVGGAIDWIGGHGMGYLIDHYVEVDNYVVCSVGRIDIGSKKETVSIGVLGHVFTFDKEDVDKFLLRTFERQLGLEGAPTASHQQVVPLPADPIEEDDDSYLAPPIEEADTVADDDLAAIAQELLDSVAATAKREATKKAKEWVQKQLESLADDQ
ncbi:MAG: DUF4339 domain-containing protein [Muribaculaceae bacterium]|nr:DUF4339 domain-containing protein [Muribaculaceae bacterium]